MAAALNQMHGNSGEPPAAAPTAGQTSALARLREAAERFGDPPGDLSSQGALEELLAKSTYEGASSTVVALDVNALALPAAGFAPVCLESVGAHPHTPASHAPMHTHTHEPMR